MMCKRRPEQGSHRIGELVAVKIAMDVIGEYKVLLSCQAVSHESWSYFRGFGVRMVRLRI